jgi:hypothetical protein
MLAAIIIIIVVVGVALFQGDDSNRRQTPESGPSTPAAAIEGEKITWHHTLPEALAEAKTSNTLIRVDFHADWCVNVKTTFQFAYGQAIVTADADFAEGDDVLIPRQFTQSIIEHSQWDIDDERDVRDLFQTPQVRERQPSVHSRRRVVR